MCAWSAWLTKKNPAYKKRSRQDASAHFYDQLEKNNLAYDNLNCPGLRRRRSGSGLKCPLSQDPWSTHGPINTFNQRLYQGYGSSYQLITRYHQEGMDLRRSTVSLSAHFSLKLWINLNQIWISWPLHFSLDPTPLTSTRSCPNTSNYAQFLSTALEMSYKLNWN